MDQVRVSKRLSLVLRHRPESVGLELDPSGWVAVDELLPALGRHGLRLTEAQLAAVVQGNDEQRFELADGRIRARQGHSRAVDLGLVPQDPPELLWHGTVERVVPGILREGLRPGRRQHVHLSPDVETARRVGARRGQPVVLEVLAGEAAWDGSVFLLSTNGVWLTDAVPPQFVRRTSS